MRENTSPRPAGGPVNAVARRASAALDAAQAAADGPPPSLAFLLGGSEIEPPPSFGARLRTDFISGMGKVAGKFVILLNIARVLSAEDIALLTQAASAEAGAGPSA